MRPTQIENWALTIIDRVTSGQPVEDARVELKSTWIDEKKAARQIAGLANASRGEPVMWLIGVDEDAGEVVGAERNDLADWLPTVFSEFDGVTPEVIDIDIHTDNGLAVVALYFETERAPFVVKNPVHGQQAGGPVALEVPWRVGTSTRTATRSNLLSILVPMQYLPEAEVLGGELSIASDKDGDYLWNAKIDLYVIPRNDTRIVFPFHWCNASFRIPEYLDEIQLSKIELKPLYKGIFFTSRLGRYSGEKPPPSSLTVDSTPTEIILIGPGFVTFTGNIKTAPVDHDGFENDIELKIKMRPTNVQRSLEVLVSLSHFGQTGERDQSISRWRV